MVLQALDDELDGIIFFVDVRVVCCNLTAAHVFVLVNLFVDVATNLQHNCICLHFEDLVVRGRLRLKMVLNSREKCAWGLLCNLDVFANLLGNGSKHGAHESVSGMAVPEEHSLVGRNSDVVIKCLTNLESANRGARSHSPESKVGLAESRQAWQIVVVVRGCNCWGLAWLVFSKWVGFRRRSRTSGRFGLIGAA